jgi:hypothetical protein
VGVSSSEEVGVYKYVHVGEKYELMVGKSKITMYANGEIIIEGDDIDITGTEHVEIIAPKIYIDGVEKKQGIDEYETIEHQYELVDEFGNPLEDYRYDVLVDGEFLQKSGDFSLGKSIVIKGADAEIITWLNKSGVFGS